MSNGKLYINFDTFYPSAYKPAEVVVGPENYDGERRFIYAVVNAFWLPPANPGDQGGLAEYFQWTGSMLDEPNRVVLLSGQAISNIKDVDRMRMVPVPLPPMTKLGFSATWSPEFENIGSVEVDDSTGTLGRYTVKPTVPDPADPLLLPAKLWPLFAIANFNIPTAHRWVDLTPPQQTEVIEWCCAIIPRLNEKASSLTGHEKKAYGLYERNAILNPGTQGKPEGREVADPNSDKVLHRKWREELLSRNWDEQAQEIPLAGGVFETLVCAGETLKVVGTPPKLLIDPAILAGRPDLVLSSAFLEGTPNAGKQLTGMSYHRRFWESMKTIVGTQFNESEKNDVRVKRIAGEKTVSQALGQLFGYGERLRWKKPLEPKGDARFMRPLKDSKRVAKLTDPDTGLFHHLFEDPQISVGEWFGTNAQSLLGQVIRLGPFADDPESGELKVDKLDIQSLSIGKGTDLSEACQELANILLLNIGDANKALSQEFKATFERDRENPNGLVFYAPKMVLGAPSKLTAPDGGQLFEPPGVLLDMVDPTPRVDMPAAKNPNDAGQENSLLIFNPARTGFKASELYRPEIVSESYRHYFGVKLEARKEHLPKASETVLKLTILNKLEPEEWRFILPVLESLENAEGDTWSNRAPTIWIAAGGADVNDGGSATTESEAILPGTILSIMSVKDTSGRVIRIDMLMRDPDDRILNCLKRAANTSSEQGDENSRRYFAQFVVNVAFGKDGEYANLWQWTGTDAPKALPLFMSNATFTSRVSRSVERLTERFQITLSPSPWSTGNAGERVDYHFGNFNKLRLAMRDADNPKANPSWLTYPDAVANLITKEEAVASGFDELIRSIDWASPPEDGPPHYTYMIPHVFAQEIQDDPLATENMRFEAYRDAGRVWQLVGNIEHQYSYRFPFIAGNGDDDDGTLRLQLTTDIRHPSELGQRGVQGEVKDEDERKESKRLRSLVAFDHRPGSANEDERISIYFLKNALKNMLIAYDNTEQLNTQGSARPAQLRELYESLLDLRFALQADEDDTEQTAGDLTLLLERWNFDNENPVVSEAEIFGLNPYPSIAANMLCVETGTVSLRSVPDIESTVLETLDDLLNGTFDNFVAKVREHAAIDDDIAFGGDAPWMKFDVQLDRSDTTRWKWGGRSTSSLYEDTNAIRVGLTLKRQARVVADDSYGEGSFFGMTSNSADTSRAPALKGENFENDDLRKKAKKELAEYFDRDAAELSPLYQKFMWLPSLDIDQKPSSSSVIADFSDADRYDPQRYQRLFGEVLPILNFPTKFRRDVHQVVNIYYLPHAFVPLQAHPAMLDAKTTTEFAQFLVRAVGEIAAGKLPSEIGVKDEQIAPDLALELRSECRNLLGDDDGIADILAGLVTYVDDRASILEHWDDPALDLNTLERRRVEKRFFEQIHMKLLKPLDTSIKRGLRELLTREPTLFETAKGFGLGLFDENTFSERIYDIQLHKKIRRLNTGGVDVSVDSPVDTDEMSFAQFLGKSGKRFFIDVLDDKSYDNEFEIDQNTYTTRESHQQEWRDVDHIMEDRVGRQVELVPGLTQIKERGAALGRTAEDHIEQRNYFKSANDQNPRNVELNVIHYNPEWRIRRENPNEVSNWLYILPSRWFPPMPVAITPKQEQEDDSSDGAFNDNSPWRSVIMLNWQDPPIQRMEDRFKKEVTKVLDKKWEVSLPAAGGESNRRVASLLPGTRDVADGTEAEGWHHIESYLSHYYFVIDADEEGSSADELFSNDAIEIFTEVADKPFEKHPREIKVERAKPVSELHKWFLYSRRLSQGTSETVPTDEQQKDLALGDVVNELKLWTRDYESNEAKPFTEGKPLLNGRTDASNDRSSPLDEATEEGDGELYATWSRYWFSGGRWKLEHKKSEGGPDNDIGNVVAAEIFIFDEQDPNESNQQYLLRVTLLDEPWKFTRARIRVRRNFRDVDGNNDPDINPVFVLASPHSDWSDYGRQPLMIGPEDFDKFSIPDAAARLFVVPDPARKVPSLEQWYRAQLSETKSFGPLVKTATQDATFTVEHAGGTTTYNHWNVHEMTKAERSVRGTVEYSVQQRAIRTGLCGSKMGGVKALEWDVACQLLNTASGSTLDQLATDILKSETPGTDLIMRVTWSMGKDAPVLTITWPVVFLRDG